VLIVGIHPTQVTLKWWVGRRIDGNCSAFIASRTAVARPMPEAPLVMRAIFLTRVFIVSPYIFEK
jgi:hypothetical protein